MIAHARPRRGLQRVGYDLDALHRVETHVRDDDVTRVGYNGQSERVSEALGLQLRTVNIQQKGMFVGGEGGGRGGVGAWGHGHRAADLKRSHDMLLQLLQLLQRRTPTSII